MLLNYAREKRGYGGTFDLFSISAASVNIIFLKFCSVIVDSVESQFVRMPAVDAVEEHF